VIDGAEPVGGNDQCTGIQRASQVGHIPLPGYWREQASRAFDQGILRRFGEPLDLEHQGVEIDLGPGPLAGEHRRNWVRQPKDGVSRLALTGCAG
jgi:hypothetical protein